MPALEMNVFTPLSRHNAPSGWARVRTAARSDPASGSVTAKAQRMAPRTTSGSQRFFCTSVPARLSVNRSSKMITSRPSSGSMTRNTSPASVAGWPIMPTAIESETPRVRRIVRAASVA